MFFVRTEYVLYSTIRYARSEALNCRSNILCLRHRKLGKIPLLRVRLKIDGADGCGVYELHVEGLL